MSIEMAALTDLAEPDHGLARRKPAGAARENQRRGRGRNRQGHRQRHLGKSAPTAKSPRSSPSGHPSFWNPSSRPPKSMRNWTAPTPPGLSRENGPARAWPSAAGCQWPVTNQRPNIPYNQASV